MVISRLMFTLSRREVMSRRKSQLTERLVNSSVKSNTTTRFPSVYRVSTITKLLGTDRTTYLP